MYKYSENSKKQLETCHEDLQKIFNEVIKNYDCSIIKGYRSEAEQNRAYRNGFSKLKYPKSKHNKKPSLAVDVAPYPRPKGKRKIQEYYMFIGYVKGIADMLLRNGEITHQIRSGGDWDNDKDLDDNKFNDLFHFELII